MKPPTPMELETIFDAACQFFTDKAREHELDFVRHKTMIELGQNTPATTSPASTTREDVEKVAWKEASRARRLSHICRFLREECHAKNLSDLLSTDPGG